MREPAGCVEVRLRLARHGLPPARIERIVGELAEHWEDLRAAAMARGSTELDALAFAEARLGSPAQLARNIIAGLRQGSWFGRHPVVTLCVLPLLLSPLLMSAAILPLWGLDSLTGFSDKGAPDAARHAQIVAAVLWATYGVALVAAPVCLCRQIWRAGLGVRWIAAACSSSALFALARFFDADAVGRTVSAGLKFPWVLNVQTAGTLLLHVSVAAVFLFAARQAVAKTCQSINNKIQSFP